MTPTDSATNAPVTVQPRVTAENFIRAETDRAMHGIVLQGGFGKFHLNRELMEVDKQVVPRGNRDTLYSFGVFDLDAGPVRITVPDPGTRFLSLIVIDEDHYVFSVTYGGGRHTFTRDQIGTRYVLMAARILVDPANPEDLATVHALQDAITVSQPSPGRFEVPAWEEASQKKIRDALTVLGDTLPDLRRAFGSKKDVDPIRHLIGTATAWGGNPDKDAIYLNVVPAKNDGTTVHTLTIKDVPVDAFWSVSVYNAQGYIEPNKDNAYTLNNITARKGADGAIVVQFGGCSNKAQNCLPITNGWNYMVRLYRPRPEILDGTWKFPEAQHVS